MIVLEPYNAAWPLLFEREKVLLLSAAEEWKIIMGLL